MSEILDNIDTAKWKSHTVGKWETLAHVTEKFWLKYSEVEKTFKTEVREGDKFGFVKLLDGKYQLTFIRGKNTANIMLDKNAIFLEKYEFPGFSFNLQKDTNWYKLVGKEWNFSNGEFRIPHQNLDTFLAEFEKVKAKILIEATSTFQREKLSVDIAQADVLYNGNFEINSSSKLDFQKSKVDMLPFKRLLKPESLKNEDLHMLLKFFLKNLITTA